MKVSYNGVSVLDTMGFPSTSTKVSTQLGLVPLGNAPIMTRHVFDNFLVSVKRI